MVMTTGAAGTSGGRRRTSHAREAQKILGRPRTKAKWVADRASVFGQ
jgi:hypothetical protein